MGSNESTLRRRPRRRVSADGKIFRSSEIEKRIDEQIEAMSAGIAKAERGKIVRPFVVDVHVDRRRIIEERTNRLDEEIQHHTREKDEGDRAEHSVVNTFASCDAGQRVRRGVQTEFANDRAIDQVNRLEEKTFFG